MRRLLAILLVLAGIGIISYPVIRAEYYEYRQNQLKQTWNTHLQVINTEPVADAGEQPVEPEPPKPPLDLSKEMEGLLKIPSIRLEVPILTGITERNLDLAVASIEKTGRPGQPGNYGVAGHRSRYYGKLFNRLDEVVPGDRITVETKDGVYHYTVAETMVIEAEETGVLLSDGQKKQITLVTCDYSTKPYRRLIVKGDLTE